MNHAKFFGITCLGLGCMFFNLKPFLALLLGCVCSGLIDESAQRKVYHLTILLLKLCVIGISFGLNRSNIELITPFSASIISFSIILTFICSYFFSKKIKLSRKVILLISVGTAICGGSAIAAVSPIIRAKKSQIILALSSVFLLNGLAIVVFPFVGTQLKLSDSVFGLWSAIAIHDMSSVIGTTLSFSDNALKVGVSLKVLRSLFIVPIILLLAFFQKSRFSFSAIPWFLIIFILCALLVVFFPEYITIYGFLYYVSKKLTLLSLFLLGISVNLKLYFQSNLTTSVLLFASLLWIVVSSVSLLYLLVF